LGLHGEAVACADVLAMTFLANGEFKSTMFSRFCALFQAANLPVLPPENYEVYCFIEAHWR